MDFIVNDKKQETSPLFENTGFDGILTCVHCGLCLDACPTYRELGKEQDSPRGRLYLMRGLWENELKLTQEVIDPLNRCLDCRACETACPSSVPYGELLEKTRGVIQENHPQSFKEKLLRALLLKQLLLSTQLLEMMSVVMKIYLTLQIPRLITETFLSKILPKSIVTGQYMLPQFSGKSFKRRYFKHGNLLPTHQQRNNHPSKNYKVGFFSGCIMDVSESEIHEASVKLLQAAGYEIIIPLKQNCCGALQVHSGDRQTAKQLAEQNLEAFKIDALEAIITNAAGCSTQLKEYRHLFSSNETKGRLSVEQPSISNNDISAFENKIIDILEFLSSVPDLVKNLQWKEDVEGHPDEIIFYDAPCHLKHGQGVDKNPQALLNQLPGVKLIPLAESDWCCGSAGIYNLTQPDLAQSILKRKTDSIRQALTEYPTATTLVTGNPGCLFQIRAGIQSNKIPLRVIHPVVFMAERLL